MGLFSKAKDAQQAAADAMARPAPWAAQACSR